MTRLAFVDPTSSKVDLQQLQPCRADFYIGSFMMCRGVQAGSYGKNHTSYGEY
jgi:hypothetical protein